MIEATDLPGVDADLALRIIAVAISIAPCLDALPAGRDRSSAIAILKSIAADAKARGSLMVKAQRIGPAGVDYADMKSWFSEDDRGALRAMCNVAASANANTPIGRFPIPGIVERLWPEDRETY